MAEIVLDRPEVLRVLFYPRPEEDWDASASSAIPVAIPVESGVQIGGRLHTAGPQAPLILAFHGNGEIAADYDDLGPLYNQLGISLLVVDYRGYGTSGGSPTASDLLTDALAVFERLGDLVEKHGLLPSELYVMGRSLGSAAAIEVAEHAGDRVAGLIVESGFADTFGLLRRLGVRLPGVDEARDGFDNAAKIGRVGVPTLIIHGEEDSLIPSEDGEELYRSSGAPDKRLVLIPGAGHNDLLWIGQEAYFRAIDDLVGAG